MIEWFFNYSTRWQFIVFLSSFVAHFEGNLLEGRQLFLGDILWWGAIFLGGNFSRGQLSSGAIVRVAIIRGAIFLGGNFSRGQLSGWQLSAGQSSTGQLSRGQLSRGQYSSGAIVLEPIKTIQTNSILRLFITKIIHGKVNLICQICY